MSKRKGHRKKRRAKKKPPKGPQARLRTLAAALNACEQRGEPIRFVGGAVFAGAGVILPPVKKGQRWEARMFAGTVDVPLQPDDLDE